MLDVNESNLYVPSCVDELSFYHPINKFDVTQKLLLQGIQKEEDNRFT